MMSLLLHIFFSSVVFAGEGSGHSHGSSGETEHLYPVLAVFAVLVIGGAAFHFMSKKKK